jgi:glyoxylase I family protein
VFEAIHHVSLEISDLEKAKWFYEEVLQLQKSNKRPDFGFGGAWYELGDTQIHLIEQQDPSQNTKPELNSRYGHFAIRAKSMEQLLERLDQYNISYINNPTNKTPWHQVYVQDPDGNIIEFNA